MDNKVMIKIKKLLELSQSNNENEAETALLKAQELLVKHKLTMSEIECLNENEANITKIETDVVFKKLRWKPNLATIISKNFSCKVYSLGTRYKKQVVILGREEDAYVCNIVLNYAVDYVEDEVKKIKSRRKKVGLGVAGVEQDYAIGFISGLKEQYEKQVDKSGWGLVIQTPKDVQEAYANLSLDRAISSRVNFRGNTDVYQKGYKAGENFSVNDKIDNKSNTQLLT